MTKLYSTTDIQRLLLETRMRQLRKRQKEEQQLNLKLQVREERKRRIEERQQQRAQQQQRYVSQLDPLSFNEETLYTTEEELHEAEERGEGKLNWKAFRKLIEKTRKKNENYKTDNNR